MANLAAIITAVTILRGVAAGSTSSVASATRQHHSHGIDYCPADDGQAHTHRIDLDKRNVVHFSRRHPFERAVAPMSQPGTSALGKQWHRWLQ